MNPKMDTHNMNIYIQTVFKLVNIDLNCFIHKDIFYIEIPHDFNTKCFIKNCKKKLVHILEEIQSIGGENIILYIDKKVEYLDILTTVLLYVGFERRIKCTNENISIKQYLLFEYIF